MPSAPLHPLLICLAAAALNFNQAAAPDAEISPSVSAQDIAWSTLNFKAGTAGHEFDTYGDVFAPVWQDESTVFFLEPYSRNTTGTDLDAGAGLGLRRLVTDDWAVGVHTFYDHSWFHGANAFDVSQFGAGVEVIGTWLDFRTNYYLPQTGGHVVASQRIGETVVGLGDPYGLQHGIVQNVQSLGINRKSVVAAGQGVDAEVGALVPWLDRWLETRAYVGGYWYENKAGPDLKGLKARAEARLTRWLYADVAWIEDKAVAGGSWFAGLRVSLPLGRAPSSTPAPSPLMSSLGYESVARRARDRMSESVERNSRAVITTHTLQTAFTPLGAPRTLTLRDDVVFVDGRLGNAGAFGTFEHPLSTIQDGVNRSAGLYGSQGTVFVQGRPSAYPESVLIGTGVQLFGSGYGLPVFSPVTGAFAFQGRTTTSPVVTGGFLAHNIPGPIGIFGFELTGGLSSPWVSATSRPAAATNIFLENVGHAVIAHNTIQGTTTATAGIYVETNGAHTSSVQIIQNSIHDNASLPSQGLQDVVLESNGTSTLNTVLSGNTIVHNGGDGVVAATFDTSLLRATLTGNTISFNGNDQIMGLNVGGTLQFISASTLSNSVHEISGATSLYETFGGSPVGAILINGTLQPASSNLP